MNNIEYVENKLKKYGAEIYEYRGVKFIGIKNPYSDNNMAITFGNEENVMEFTYQTARFAASDLDGLIAHAEKFLKNELCAQNFFSAEKDFSADRERSRGRILIRSTNCSRGTAAETKKSRKTCADFSKTTE